MTIQIVILPKEQIYKTIRQLWYILQFEVVESANHFFQYTKVA